MVPLQSGPGEPLFPAMIVFLRKVAREFIWIPPPPPVVAVLFAIVTLLRTNWPLFPAPFARAPPPCPAVFPLKVQLVAVIIAPKLPPANAAPPSWVAEFLEK